MLINLHYIKKKSFQKWLLLAGGVLIFGWTGMCRSNGSLFYKKSLNMGPAFLQKNSLNMHWKKNWASFDTKRGVQIWVLRWTSKGDRVTPLKSVMTPWWCQFIVYTFGCSPEDPFLRVSNDTFSGVKVNLLGVNLLFTPLDVRLRTHF